MLPVFALFNPALGMTTVVPEINPSKPAQVDPAKIVQAIQQEQVTNSFGSPTLWGKIADHCLAKNITLPSVRRVLCAGAPVPAKLWENSRHFLPNGKLHSPYGATEALPISTVSADEIAAASVRGACVGRPVREINVKIIAIDDGPIPTLAEACELPAGEIGEIIVRGPVVTKTYDALAAATATSKIQDAEGGVWHRMGDCGHRDADGRLWFSGRKAELVEAANSTFFTEPCEQVFRTVPGVARCALIGLGTRGAQVPALVVQPIEKLSPAATQSLAAALRERAKLHTHTQSITRYYFHPSFPVDVRHNAKIHRLTLAKWAATAKGYDLP
jgi:acyl-coenzyme A synthetase/AMP-(fatty) acid ligase